MKLIKITRRFQDRMEMYIDLIPLFKLSSVMCDLFMTSFPCTSNLVKEALIC